MDKKDYKNILILVLIGSLLIFFIGLNKIYGSKTDWINQHVVFPEYFRMLFYKTHNIFPNFSFNIGAGQNIFNFAYYGLYNPFILLSYLFPFIKMINYIQGINIIIVFISTILIYKWLKNNNYSSKVCFISSLLFMCASPIIYHSHKHFMFMSYFPFLILALIGVDKYFNNKKCSLLIINIFLMILTNYYYSVCGLIVIGIYGIFKYLNINKKFILKEFIIFLIKFVLVMLIGIFLSSFLLFPIINTLLGSSRNQNIIKLLTLFIPNLSPINMLYDRYSLGVTSVGVIGLIYAFITKKKSNIFLSIVVSIFIIIPIFMFILNGALYIRPKALIPFLPLVILLISKYLEDLIKKKINIKLLIKSLIIISVLIIIYGIIKKDLYLLIFIFEMSITIIILIFIYKKNIINYYLVFIMIMSLSVCSINNINTNSLVDNNSYNKIYNSGQVSLINSVLKYDNSFYRFNNYDGLYSVNKIYDINYYQNSLYSSTYNEYFNKSSHNDFSNPFGYRNSLINSQVNNIMYNTYMSVKYTIDSEDYSFGYKKINSNNKYNLYRNDSIFSLGYVNSKTLSLKEFNNLEFPYKSEALLNFIITKNSNSIYNTNVKDIQEDLIINSTNTVITYKDYKIIIDSPKNGYINLSLLNNDYNKILFISFDLLKNQSCNKGDLSISINNVINKLTCKDWIYKNNNNTFHYTLSDSKNVLNIKLNKGKFIINNINLLTLDYNYLLESVDNIDKLKDIKVFDNKLSGNINVTNDGYFVFTIPYDKGFTIKVDNSVVDYENVNNGYIGFKINKGKHSINLEYNAPLFKEGKIISIISLFTFIGLVIYENKKVKTK